ncbi:MAG: alpha/beta fold hydrolase [Candidatus Hydrogenedens sp.]|nr:alpha/beta fold hydrolase [Candidatus Hydrogenedens sp.]
MSTPPDQPNRNARHRAEHHPIAIGFIRKVFAVLGVVAPDLGGRLATRIFRTPRRHQTPAFEQEIRAKAARHDTVEHEGMRLDVLEWGAGERAVLLVHGWEGRGTHLGRFVEPLVAAGFRVVAFDGPAHGQSEGKRTDVITFSSSLHTMASQKGPFYAAIGHSFGGATTLFAAHCGLALERAVIIAAPSQVAYVAGRFREAVGLPDAVFERHLHHLGRCFGMSVESADVNRFVEKLDIKGMVVHCRDDAEIEVEQGERLHRAWPGSKMLATSGLGHRRVLKEPEVIGAVVAFLSGQTD